MLRSTIPSTDTNAQPVTATTENSNQQPERTKCAKFGLYSLYALPAPAGFGFLSHIITAKCGISAFSGLMCSTGVASCTFVSCSIMYCAHSLSGKNTIVNNVAKPNNDEEGYVQLLQLNGTITEQPESQNSNRRNSDSSTSIDSSFAPLNHLDDTAIVETKYLETAL